MKKILTISLCVLMLASCGPQNTQPTPEPTAVPTSTPSQNSTTVKTMISPSDKSPVKDSWTVLGEVGLTVGGEYCDIVLATDAQRGSDGYMMWDDSQEWALTVTNEQSTFVLFDSRMHGKAYFDVTKRGGESVITLIRTSTAGMAVTEYTYSDGAFYAEEIITPANDGNNIYSSIPDYID